MAFTLKAFRNRAGRAFEPPQAARREYEFSSPPRRVLQTISFGVAVLSTFGGLSQPGGRWSRFECERELLYQSFEGA